MLGEPSSGALLEVLGDSEFVGAFTALATQSLTVDEDIEATRIELAEAFAKLELRRTQSELAALAALPPTSETLNRIRELGERRARLKERASTPDST
jgi:hypothetical protein